MDTREAVLDVLGSKWFQGLALLAAAVVCWLALDWLSYRAMLSWSARASHLIEVLRWAGTVIMVIWGLVLLAAAVSE